MSKFLSVLFLLVLIGIFSGEPVYAANQMQVRLALQGTSDPVDTLLINENYEFQLLIENDLEVGAIQGGFEVYTASGAAWTWLTQPDGYGPTGPLTGGQYLTVVPGCRMTPTDSIWDLTDIMMIERDMDGVGPDSILIGMASQNNGLAPGALEHMLSLHFSPTLTGQEKLAGTICFDTAFIPPAGDFIFSDAATGQAIIPGFAGGMCWPVVYTCPFDSDGDGFGDPGHPENQCPDDNCPDIANPDQTDTDGDGVGDACDICEGFDDNVDTDEDGVPDGCDICEGFDDNIDTDEDGVPDGCDICEGFDDNVDADSDGVPDGCDICPGFDDNVDTDADGVPDGCDICEGFDDNVDSDADGVPDGCDICEGFDDNVDSDADGVPDGCDICEGFDDNLDADADGVPDGCDVCEGFDDNIDTDEDTVPDGCDNCPETPNTDQADADQDGIGDACDYICGDANGDASVNLADVSFLINYIFNSGPNPQPQEAGDANCDGSVNIADANYLVNYIFFGGSEPCCPQKKAAAEKIDADDNRDAGR